MKTICKLFLLLILTTNLSKAQDTLYIYKAHEILFKQPITDIDSLSFKKSTSSTVKDIDGNVYHTVVIGNQTWMVENLKTTKYNDGTEIPLVTNTWQNLITPGYCWYNNSDTFYKNTYGALYNWYAINTGKLCPIGWHVPSYPERNILVNFLGGVAFAGDKLKANNFKALMGGYRYVDGKFYSLGQLGCWWTSSSTTNGTTNASNLPISIVMGQYIQDFEADKKNGYSVRCVKD